MTAYKCIQYKFYRAQKPFIRKSRPERWLNLSGLHTRFDEEWEVMENVIEKRV